MEPCSREDLQSLTINSLLDGSGNSNNHNDKAAQSHFDPASASSDDFFLEQMLSTLTSLPPSWPNISSPASAPDHHFLLDDPSYSSLAAKLRLQQIGSDHFPPTGGDVVDDVILPTGPPSSFKTLSHLDGIGGGSMDTLYNGFGGGSLLGVVGGSGAAPATFVSQEGGSVQTTPSFGSQGGAVGGSNGTQPRQRVRARRGQATDPHSIAERLRRERIAERMKALQELVPNANKTDKASMLDEIIDYVKFLQLQVKVLSMSRLGGAAAVAPLVADMSSSEGGGGGGGTAVDCGQPDGTGRVGGDSLTVTEHQVAKLMEEDMGSAMQYLQGKGLCLMPISLATAISTATCQQPRAPKSSPTPPLHFGTNGDGPSSPGMSALTVQSATTLIGNASGGSGTKS
ncbi:hypothetical protein MLD38_006321 [Melastoma candidum]|uniref:Uncharacterized protein n=1 Tax=Melastoma candidum TaxID=119954 RepID=A0ACB9RPG9_9MYRT|nr:hypothetical protein MLD38_006321 [Melastoma candidum]